MNLFSYIKSQISILEVVGQYVTLKKAGHYYKGVCPFHHEKTASFTVSPHKEIFYCFGCHTGGDAISFIEKAEKCSPLESAQHLIEHYQIDVPESLKEQKKDPCSHDERKKYYDLCQFAADWFHEKLIKSPAVLRYFQQRGIERDLIDLFSLGYFPGGLQSIKLFVHEAKKHNFLVDDLIKANLVTEGKSVLYSPYEERVIFPIKDHLGRPCGFGGRIYKKNDERAKYYNSRENPYFAKGSLLFGLDQAKKHIQEKESVILVEGYTDCLAMVKYEFPQTVATLGTACTLEHLQLLGRYTQMLYILYDGDQAGHNAMLRLTELCWQVDLELKIIELPTGDDPASFLNNRNNLQPLIDQAQDIFLFLLSSSAKNFFQKGMNEKVAIVRALLTKISGLTDPLKKEMLLQRAAKTFDIPFESLKSELNRSANKQKNEQKSFPKDILEENKGPSSSPQELLKEIPILEKKLFSVIINNVHMLQPEDEEYLLSYLSQSLQALFKKLREIKGEASQLDFMLFFDAANEKEKLLMSKLVLECHEYEGPENFEYLFEQFQKKNWKTFITDTKIKLERAKQEGDQQAMHHILDNFQKLKKKLLRKGLI
jgi:DNA primase